MIAPKVEVKSVSVADNCYHRDGYTWAALNLIEAAKDCEEFDYPLAAANLDYCWPIKDMQEFICHVKRVQDTDEKHPIILDDKGNCCDGRHRIAKAILAGKTTIKAKRLQKMPTYDCYEKPGA